MPAHLRAILQITVPILARRQQKITRIRHRASSKGRKQRDCKQRSMQTASFGCMIQLAIRLERSTQMARRERSSSLQVRPTFNVNREYWFHKPSSLMPYTCPVCGFPDLAEIPRSEKGGGSYEICPSCSFQFGVSDDDRGFTYQQWREHWIKQGTPWDKGRTKPPVDWNPREQLRNIEH